MQSHLRILWSLRRSWPSVTARMLWVTENAPSPTSEGSAHFHPQGPLGRLSGLLSLFRDWNTTRTLLARPLLHAIRFLQFFPCDLSFLHWRPSDLKHQNWSHTPFFNALTHPAPSSPWSSSTHSDPTPLRVPQVLHHASPPSDNPPLERLSHWPSSDLYTFLRRF